MKLNSFAEFSVYVDPPRHHMLLIFRSLLDIVVNDKFLLSFFQDGVLFQGFNTDEFGEKKCFVDTLYKFENTQLHKV
jgi:hypothetical protein